MTRNYENQPPTAFQRIPDHTRDDDWIRAFLREQKVGHTAYAWDDQPFLHPNLFWFDEENHQIIFHGNIAGRIRLAWRKIRRSVWKSARWANSCPRTSPWNLRCNIAV